MNILILSWRGPGNPNAGGAEQVTLEHAKAWVKAGHDVWLFTSFFKGAKKYEKLFGINIVRKGRQIFGVQLRAFIWYVFRRFSKRPKIDLVVDEFHGIPFFTPFYVKTAKLAFIHEVAKEVWRFNPWPVPLNFIPAILGRIFEPLIFRIVYRRIPFMTVSESTKKDLITWGIGKNAITVIENGVSLYLPKQIPEKETVFTALYLGAISHDKGIFEAIKTFAEIYKLDEDWQFWVVGKGAPKIYKKVKNLVQRLKIKKRVKYFGFVSDKKKFELLARAHVLINPSLREGWGLVNIEANAAGTPVMGYNVSGMKDSVKDGKTGILVERGDYRSLAANTLKLVHNREKYNSFCQRAKKWSEKFSWQKATKESLELIESL